MITGGTIVVEFTKKLLSLFIQKVPEAAKLLKESLALLEENEKYAILQVIGLNPEFNMLYNLILYPDKPLEYYDKHFEKILTHEGSQAKLEEITDADGAKGRDLKELATQPTNQDLIIKLQGIGLPEGVIRGLLRAYNKAKHSTIPCQQDLAKLTDAADVEHKLNQEDSNLRALIIQVYKTVYETLELVAEVKKDLSQNSVFTPSISNQVDHKTILSHI